MKEQLQKRNDKEIQLTQQNTELSTQIWNLEKIVQILPYLEFTERKRTNIRTTKISRIITKVESLKQLNRSKGSKLQNFDRIIGKEDENIRI